MLSFAVFFVLCLKAQRSISQEDCRELWFTTFIEGKALKNHVIQTVKVMDEDFCGDKCLMEDTCVSYNFGSESGSNNCELNNATASEHPGDLEEVRGYIYRGSLNACNGNLCKHNATCQSGYTDKGYRCVCIAGYTAEHCDVDIDECASNPCQNGGNCSDLMNDYNCSCYPGYTGKMCEEVPEECRHYKNLTEKSRKFPGRTGNQNCDKDLSGWYRFTGEAGTRMYNTCLKRWNVCGTSFPGYLDDAEPEASEGQVERDVCFVYNGCKDYCSKIQVRRCVSFLVYNLTSDLSPKPVCNYRFCGSD